MKLSTHKKTVDIDLIVANKWNPNKMSDFTYQKMKATISEKGLFGSIFVRPFSGCYEILDGEHRVKACRELGYKTLPVEISEEMTEKEVQFWTLYFNNTRGKDDIEKVARIFEQLDEGQLQLLPYSDEAIENTKDLFKFDFAQYDVKEKDSSESLKVFSIKFTQEEWETMKQAIDISKTEGKSAKQMILGLAEYFLDIRGLFNSLK